MTDKKKRGASIGNTYAAKENKTETGITIRLTHAQKEIYNAYAEECGLSLTKIVKQLLDNAMIADKFK